MSLVIDVSEHQGKINWNLVKSQISGAIIRCGYGDDIESQDDKYWDYNIKACEERGIPAGAYLYSYAYTDGMAKSELAHLRRLLKGHKFQLPIFLDCEENGTQGYAPKACNIILDGLLSDGYKVGVYANLHWWQTYLGDIVKYPRWIAQYNTTCDYPGKYIGWQYTSKGSINGIAGNVDLNNWYGDIDTITITPKPTKPPSIDFTYSVKIADGRILEPVTNLNDYAGVIGQTIRAIAIKSNIGSVMYRVHTITSGWLPYVTGYNWSDYKNGYAGDGNPIDLVKVYYYTPKDYGDKYGYHKATYRVSPVNQGYYPWQTDNDKSDGMDGYAGSPGIPIDRFQLY